MDSENKNTDKENEFEVNTMIDTSDLDIVELTNYENSLIFESGYSKTQNQLLISTDDGWGSPSTISCKKFTGCSRLLIKKPVMEVEYFNIFFTSKLFNFVVKYTNRNIIEKNKHLPIDKRPHLIDTLELYGYLSLLLILGLKNTPNHSYCWNKSKKYAYCPIISKIMSYERFTTINKHITCISSNDINTIKLKRKPKIIDFLERLFLNTYVPGENIAIDEGMMAYKGRIKNRVYSPCKPDKWGMKFYILAESETGFVYNLRIVGERFSLENTILELTENLVGCGRSLFVDNYYNSYKLAELLFIKDLYIGMWDFEKYTWRTKKLLRLKKEIQRGESLFYQKSNSQILIWCDKKPVVMLTTKFDVTIQAENEEKSLPNVIEKYNKYMGSRQI